MKKFLLFIPLLMLAMIFQSFISGGSDVLVIVNKDNPVNEISAGEAKLLWLRKVKKRWPEINKNIRPAGYKSNNAAQTAFYSKVLNMSAADVETYFTQKQYENAEKPQDKFASENDLVNFVGDEVGAIGFVSAGSLSAADKAKVKVVCTIAN